MPSTATITAFYSFTANTKARATQVNANFDVFRGHIIPISAITQTAANNTYDLGSTEYRWRDNYVRSIDFISNTSTGNALAIMGETTSSTPAFVFKVAGSEAFRVEANGPATSTVYQYAMKAKTITTNGSDPGTGGVVYGAEFLANLAGGANTTGNYFIPGCTCTISVVAGRPVQISIVKSASWTNIGQATGATTTSINGGSLPLDFILRLYRDTTTSQIATWTYSYSFPALTTTAYNANVSLPLGVPLYDESATTGTHTYFLSLDGDVRFNRSAQGRLCIFQP